MWMLREESMRGHTTHWPLGSVLSLPWENPSHSGAPLGATGVPVLGGVLTTCWERITHMKNFR